MKCTRHPGLGLLVVLLSLATLIAGIVGMAQSGPTGKLRITVSPKQAYVFVDGKAIRDGRQTIVLTAGQHEVAVENYGYLPKMEQAQIVAGQTMALQVTLQKSGDQVLGPFGDIEFKGHPRAAVLLNGTTPAFFVGQVDEFDNNWIWHQWLLVKQGTYQATIVQKGETIWSGPIAVKAGERVIVDLNHNGKMTTKDFKQGLTMRPQPRFEAGIASALVPIAPVTAQLSASPTQTNSGQSSSLSWKTTDAAETTISNFGTVAASGDRTVSPCQTTTYELAAKGPGGEATPSATINVNGQPTATLSLSQPQIAYHKVGDKVVEQDSATLSWTSSNANSVTIQPLGGVAATGSQNIQAAPGQTSSGPINRDVTYTLQATNTCGGTVTRTATLHIGGSIDPAPAPPAPPSLTLASLFYPTNYPLRHNPKVGLVASQQRTLAELAKNFKNHMQYDNAAKLVIIGHADARGDKKYNLGLSQRRADRAKDYLISQGIAAGRIDVRAEGRDHQLDEKQVERLQSQDAEKTPKWMASRKKDTWLAYNRRVDVNLEPNGQESTLVYPSDAPDAHILWQRAQPSLKSIETATPIQTSSGSRQIQSIGLISLLSLGMAASLWFAAAKTK